MLTEKNFVNSYIIENDVKGKKEVYILYSTGLNTYEECLTDGIFYSCGWLGSGFVPQQIDTPCVPRMNYRRFVEGSAFVINVNGQQLNSHWEFLSYEKTETKKGLLVCVKLFHAVTKTELAIYTLLDGTAIITRWLDITNKSDKLMLLSNLSVISGGLQITPRFKDYLKAGQSLYRLGYMEETNWGLEGMFKWHDLPNAGYYICGKFMRDRFRHPMFVLENRATGEHIICQFAYSGGWRFDFDFEEDKWAQSGSGNGNLSYKVSMDGFSPLIDIAPGETMPTPEVHIGMTFGSLDDGINAMHDHIRKSVMIHQENWNAPIECGIGPEMDMSQEAVLKSIEYAAKHKAEYYFIDAGWFMPKDSTKGWYAHMGDWFPEQERYDLTIDGIRELCHSKGMKFGLWMEPERVVYDSWVFKEHPEWLAPTYATPLDQEKITEFGPIAVSRDEVFKWIEEQIEGLIVRYKLDFFRLDYNDFRRSYDYRNGNIVNADYRYNNNFYSIFDRQRKKYPDVIFENCASGGGRTDLGMVKRMSHSWVTDWQHAPRSFAIINGLSMCLPPEYIDRLLGGQSGHLEGTFDFQSRLILFGRPTLTATTITGMAENPIQSEKLDHILDIYRSVVRPFHHDSKIYHHTPEVSDSVEPKGVGILEMAANDGHVAIAGIFNLAAAGESHTLFRFKGLDISKDYMLTMDNKRKSAKVSGYSLMNEGVNVYLDGALTCELLIAQECK